MARTVILSDSGKWVTLLRFEWEWGEYMSTEINAEQNTQQDDKK
ncbi:hypothetical protein [Symbiopectobacterium purcellii]